MEARRTDVGKVQRSPRKKLVSDILFHAPGPSGKTKTALTERSSSARLDVGPSCVGRTESWSTVRLSERSPPDSVKVKTVGRAELTMKL